MCLFCSLGNVVLHGSVIRLYRKETTARKDQKILSKTRNTETSQCFLLAMTSESSCKTVPFVDQDSKTFRFASVRVWPAKNGMTRTVELWKVWTFLVQWHQKVCKQIAKMNHRTSCLSEVNWHENHCISSSSLWHVYIPAAFFERSPGQILKAFVPSGWSSDVNGVCSTPRIPVNSPSHERKVQDTVETSSAAIKAISNFKETSSNWQIHANPPSKLHDE